MDGTSCYGRLYLFTIRTLHFDSKCQVLGDNLIDYYEVEREESTSVALLILHGSAILIRFIPYFKENLPICKKNLTEREHLI